VAKRRPSPRPSLDSLFRQLEAAVKGLNGAVLQIRDLPLEPRKAHIYRIGKALTEIFDIQYHVFALRPSLTPHIFKGPFEHPEGALNVAMRHAGAAEKAGNPDVAIAILKWVSSRIQGTAYEQKARAQIKRLSTRRAARKGRGVKQPPARKARFPP